MQRVPKKPPLLAENKGSPPEYIAVTVTFPLTKGQPFLNFSVLVF